MARRRGAKRIVREVRSITRFGGAFGTQAIKLQTAKQRKQRAGLIKRKRKIAQKVVGKVQSRGASARILDRYI